MRRSAWAIVLALVLAGAVAPVSGVRDSVAEASSRRVLGYYVTYDATSWASLESRAHLVDLVAVRWVTIDACGRLTASDDQTLKRFARSRGIKVLPSLGTFSSWLNHRLLTDDGTAARALGEVVDYVVGEGHDGLDLDLEGVQPEDRGAYTAFVARLGSALHERGKLLTLAVPAKTADTTGWGGAFDYAALGAHADLVTIMAYEYHGSWSGPGPIASYAWVEQVAAFAVSQIPPEKVLLGLASYGFDWNTTAGGARYLGWPEAAVLSERYGAPIALDPATWS
jgi:spore germination protein YaaH